MRRPPRFVRRWRHETRPGRERGGPPPHRPPPPDDLPRGVRHAPEARGPRGSGDGRRGGRERPRSDRLAGRGAPVGPQPSQGAARRRRRSLSSTRTTTRSRSSSRPASSRTRPRRRRSTRCSAASRPTCRGATGEGADVRVRRPPARQGDVRHPRASRGAGAASSGCRRSSARTRWTDATAPSSKET